MKKTEDEDGSYGKDVEIHPNRLDEEIIRQPSLYMKYAEMSARAKYDMDKAKEQLDLCRAVIDKRIREQNADKKLTVDAINAMITDSPEYKLANQTFMNAGLDYNILIGAREAFSHKKSSLDNLTKLLIAGFFSDILTCSETKYVGDKTVEKVTDSLQISDRKPAQRRTLG